MRTIKQPLIVLGLPLLLLAAAAAFGDDTVTIRIYNDDPDDIVVTVYDLNARPAAAVLESQRINGFAWIPISVAAGRVGKGHVKWTARTADEGFHRCGHQDRRGLANDDSVRIFVDSSCVKRAR